MWTMGLAFFIDLAIGDPYFALHPVRLMGRAIEAAEKWLRKSIANEKLAGGLLAFSFPVFVFGITAGTLALFYQIHPWLSFGGNVLGIYFALSIHDLRKEALQIERDLEDNNLEKARKDLARIVGRDTETLSREEVLRASIETVAESTLDGIAAPLFFAAIGGAPLAMAYKAVNTLDSMIGHLNERYRHFGFWAAKQDEAWNWLPARLSYFMVTLASFLLGQRSKEALRDGWRDGMAQSHGNGSIPEACFAGALGLRLGGVNLYEGRQIEKPFLGKSEKEFEIEDLKKSLQLMIWSSYLGLISALLIRYLIEFFIVIPAKAGIHF